MSLTCPTGLTPSSPLFRSRPAAPRFGAILIHVGLSTASGELLADAVELANDFGARLIGVSTPPESDTFVQSSPAEAGAAALLLEAAADRFDSASQRVHAGAFWAKVEGSAAEALGAYGWAADLIVVDHPLSAGGAVRADGLEALAIRTGAPILIRGSGGMRRRSRDVVIVWDQTGACHRALVSALPFLGRADSVTILAPPWRPRRGGRERILEDLRRGLATRGIDVRLARLDEEGPPDVVFEQAQALDPDLIVMAGWPDRPPWAFHGVTEAILPSLTTAALLHH